MFVKNNEIWNLPQSENNTILHALRLSYFHLTLELMQCFAFCAAFPKNTKMIKEELIHLWMANNLFQLEGERTMEDTRNQIFRELSLRSFFKDKEKYTYGVFISCVMNDLVHDLACSINMNECFHLDGIKATTRVHRDTQNLSLDTWRDRTSNIQSLKQSPAKLCTFFLSNNTFNIDYVNLACLSSLCALDVPSFRIDIRPNYIRKLKHLR